MAARDDREVGLLTPAARTACVVALCALTAARFALAAAPGVTSVEVRGERVRLQSSDSDGVLRYLLLHTEARYLEVTSRNLEDTFIALTSDQPDPGPGLNGAGPDHTQPAPAGATPRSQS